MEKTAHPVKHVDAARSEKAEILWPCQAKNSQVRSSSNVNLRPIGKTEEDPLPQMTSEFGTNNTKGLPFRELVDLALAARSRWLSSPSNAKLLAKLAELLPSVSIPQTPDGGWAKSCEPVGVEQALHACFVGNRSLLARYFRETEKVNLNIVLLFVSMLDPRLASKQAARYDIRSRKRGRANPPCVLDLSLSDIADLLDPTPDQKWEIRFVGRKGNTQKGLQWETFFRMEVARAKRGERGKLKGVVYDIMKEAKCERAQVFRDDKACKEFWGALKNVLEELGEDETQWLLQTTAWKVDDLLNHAAITNRLLTDLANRLVNDCAPDA